MHNQCDISLNEAIAFQKSPLAAGGGDLRVAIAPGPSGCSGRGSGSEVRGVPLGRGAGGALLQAVSNDLDADQPLAAVAHLKSWASSPGRGRS